MKFSRHWAMPNKNTFSIPPIGAFVNRYIRQSTASVDPFARNFSATTVTNDLNPETTAQYHLDALDFFSLMAKEGKKFDLLIFDPPYSPRQISECYKSVGRPVGMKETQSGSLYAAVREAALPVLARACTVISFGWNTVGMGIKRNFCLEEIMLVCHGGAHNDTICIAEKRYR